MTTGTLQRQLGTAGRSDDDPGRCGVNGAGEGPHPSPGSRASSSAVRAVPAMGPRREPGPGLIPGLMPVLIAMLVPAGAGRVSEAGAGAPRGDASGTARGCGCGGRGDGQRVTAVWLVQNQTCTRFQDRICSCPPHKYCVSKLDKHCEVCRTHKKCGKGYRVSRRGTDSTDTECKPCPPGTFSPEESYNTSCIPHTICKSVAVPGNSTNDTVCSDSGTATVLPHTNWNLLLTQSSAFHKPEIITQPVVLNSVPDLSHITGAVAGPFLLVLIIAILGYCLVSKKKALVYSAAAAEADLSFPPPEKQCDKKVRDTELQNSRSSEQEHQHLLETSGSSSILNPTGSPTISVTSKKNYENKNSGEFQLQHSPPEGSKFLSGDGHSSASSEHSGNGGTQVNVTCIVKFCRPDCSSQCPEQMSSASRDYGHTPWCSPTGGETLLSKEENALNKETEIHIAVENEDNLLQDSLPEEKKVPLGIQDAGMKTS
ncbi:tumor necrosis factor receptor superfamily member 1B-like [Passer montanus]|uniref:tumor necrosis factor receptor superfamily member 1B-like n=1 Tax=Passer montanus TaxID=9160 RepID=UPI00195F9BFC|nr:tumor necrosis factor receptor superfamily member 1B-like [Passer montanus]